MISYAHSIYSTNPVYMEVVNDFRDFKPNQNARISDEKLRTFDDFFLYFQEPQIKNLSIFLTTLTSLPDDVADQLAPHFEKIMSRQSSLSEQKVHMYLNIIFNIICEPITNANLDTHFQRRTLINTLEALNSGCSFHQIGALRAVIIQTIIEYPALIAFTGASSPLDFYFVIALQNYRQSLIAEEIQRHAPDHLAEILEKNDPFTLKFKGLEQLFFTGELEELCPVMYQEDQSEPEDLETFAELVAVSEGMAPGEGLFLLMEAHGDIALETELDSIGADIRKESAEMIYVVEKKLGFSQDTAEAHFYENDPTTYKIMDAVQRRYEPEEFFMRELTERYPNTALRQLHAEIGCWFRSQSFDPYIRQNRALLIDKRSAVEDLWFTEKAIRYCFEKQGFFSSL